MIKNYQVQIMTYIALLNNSVSSSYIKDNVRHVSLSGLVGWPNYYHKWLEFDYWGQTFVYLIGFIIYIIKPPKEAYKTFSVLTLVLFTLFHFVELSLYEWYGNSAVSENNYWLFVSMYTFILAVIAYSLKVWK